VNLETGTVMAVVSLSSGAVALYVRAVKADLREYIGETRRQIIEQINGKYVNKDHCALKEEATRALVEGIRREAGLRAKE